MFQYYRAVTDILLLCLIVSIGAISACNATPPRAENSLEPVHQDSAKKKIAPAEIGNPDPLVERLSQDAAFVNVSTFNAIKIDFRYASTNNFLSKNVYDNFKQCFLHRLAAEKLRKALGILSERHPGWKFLIFDCLRPRSIQREMWSLVKQTPQQPYVANPDKGSLHNFGFAIDLSLIDSSGNPLDMGTAFDFFGPLAEPRKENDFLKQGKLSSEQVRNRQILRSIMQEAGFVQLPIEWWHFDALPRQEVQDHYRIVE